MLSPDFVAWVKYVRARLNLKTSDARVWWRKKKKKSTRISARLIGTADIYIFTFLDTPYRIRRLIPLEIGLVLVKYLGTQCT